MRSPRSVSATPIGLFTRSLKFEMAFLERRTYGRCPVIAIRSFVAPSMALAFSIASPSPMLIAIFSRRGICIGFA